MVGLAVALTLPVGLKAATLAPTGATFVVTSSSDAVDANLANGTCATASGACTLRAAVQQANALAGADTIQIPAGTYALAIRGQNQNLAESGDLDITGPVTIVGAGPESTIVDGGTPTSSAPEIRGLDRLFEIHASAGDVSFVGLTIREGYNAEQGGGIYNASSGHLRLESVHVIESYAAKYGGGIANAGTGRVELVGSTISGNGAKEGGSAIHNAVAGTVSITAGSAIVENPGNDSNAADDYPVTGGAINNEGEGDTIGAIEILDSTVARNEASSNGGGIYNERDGRVVVRRSAITGNRTSSSGAGIYSNSGTVLIQEGTTISGNHAGSDISSGNGGGLYNAGQLSKAGTPGRIEITNSTITGNTAKGDGAGILSGLDADLVITDSTISDNAATDEGGGISSQTKADMTVTRVTFSGNSADVAGGAVYAYAEGAASFVDSDFTENVAGETGGGGLYTDGSGTVYVVDSTFLRNTAIGDGGGLSVGSSGEQTIADSIVADNSSEEGGGGIFNSGGPVTLLRLGITGNNSGLDGGGIKSEGSSQLLIVDSTVAGNTAENGGGFTNAADGTMRVSGTTIRNNTARGDGGGYLEIGDANSEIENSTLSGNGAGDRGGGIYTNADATLRVVNVTITDNTASAGSGLSTSVESLNFPVVPATAVILRNTIVAGNHDGINCHGAVFSEGGNLDDGTTCFFSDPRDITRTAPGVEPLAANGGGSHTHALKSSSVAVDRGVDPCPEVDQRGVGRPQNASCDIGAYEFEGAPGPPDSDPLPPPTGPDSDPPTVSLDSKPALRTLDTFAEFRFRANEIARFECVLDPPAASFSGCESPHDYTNLTLGLHTFQVRAIDAAGNVGASESYTWRIVEELIPPETMIASGPPSLTRATSASFTFSANEPADFECSLDDAAFAACASPLALSALADGAHTLQVRAIDNSFNVDESPASRTWTVDTAPPETTIDSGPSGLTNDATPTFAFSSEAGATFECRVDTAAFTTCSSPYDAAALADGAHTFEVRASDAAGNIDPTPLGSGFTVDTVAPDTTLESEPSGLTNDATPTFGFSSEAGATFECRVDAEAFAACSPPYTTAELGEGAHTFEVRASDGAGNADQTPASRGVTVDTTAPETTIDSGPQGLTRATGASFAFSSTEAGSFVCSVDGAAFAACVSPLELSGLAEGSHALEVQASDAAGNADRTPARRTWTVDTLPPETTIDAGPSGLTNDATPTFGFSSEAGAAFECSLDAASFAACSPPYAIDVALSEGAHTFAVRATDAAGNTDPSAAERAFIVDTIAPETTIGAGPSGLINTRTPTFEFSAGEDGSTFECRLDAAPFAACASPYTTPSLSEDAHTFEVRAIDPAGNADGSPASRAFTIDATAPETTIDSGPPALTRSTTGSVAFSANEAATFACSLDGAVAAACTSPLELSGLVDGSHTLEVRARDAAGNVDQTAASTTWIVDTTPPETTIVSGPQGPTNDATPTFEFSSEAGASFECALDSGAFAACTSGHRTATLADGAHTYHVRAVDTAGNEDGSPASRSFVVDTVEPDTTIQDGPNGLTNDATPRFTFSSEAGATIECALDTGAFAACTSPYTTPVLSEGAHTFQVRAIDAAGNEDSSPASRAFTVDATAPETSIDSGPNGLTTSASASFTFSSNETATFRCKLDGGAFASCSSPQAYSALGEGAHTFTVQATDSAGNTDASAATREFTVDTIAPDTTISGPAGLTADSTPTFELGANESGSTFECKVDAADFAPCTSPHTTAPLADGAHVFEARARDGAGNVDATPESRSFTVDTSAPETTILEGPSGATGDSTPTFTFSSETGATFECALDDGVFAACTSPHTTAVLADGPHTFRVRATDAAGNADLSPASRTFTVDAAPPETTIDSGPSGVTTSTTATFQFSAGEPSTFECKLDAASLVSCTSPQTYSGLGDGTHTFSVQAIDSAGNRDQSPATRTWTVDTTAPQTAIESGPGGPTNDSTPTFAFSSEAGATFECRVDAAAFASCSSPHTTAVLGQGAHTFEVRARDAAGNLDASPASRSFTVDTAAPQTTIDSGPPATTTSTSATFTFSSSESGSTFACSLDGAPFAACTSPRQYTGLAVSAHQFRVQATDAAGNTDSTPATFAWTVQAPDTTGPETTIDSGPSGPTNDSTPTFAFSSEPGAAFECRVDTAAFASCTSPHTTAVLGQGAHTFEVRARDTNGNVDGSPASRAFTVDTAAPQTTIDSGPNGTTNDSTPTFAFSSEPGAAFECRVDTAAFASCTSPHTTAVLGQGAHTFEVRARDAAGNADGTPASRSFTVDTAAPQTTITSGPSDPTTETSASFTFTANEAVLRFECALDTASFMTCTSGISYPGPLAPGDHEFRVRAVDLAGNVGPADSHIWTIVASSPSDTTPPTITISGPPNETEETSAAFAFSANEPATFRCRLDAATFDNCSSPIDYSGLQPGEHVFRVEARDSAGNVAVASHTWTIVSPGGCAAGGTVTLGANADTWVLQSSATSNYGGDSAIKVDTKTGANARVLVRFGLPAIPSGCRVVAAKLRMYAGSYKTGRTLQAAALTTAWNENSVTWNNQPASDGPAASVASGSGYREWDVGPQVSGMYTSGNHGFVIRDSSENGQGVEQAFNSREKGTDNPPQLVLTFG